MRPGKGLLAVLLLTACRKVAVVDHSPPKVTAQTVEPSSAEQRRDSAGISREMLSSRSDELRRSTARAAVAHRRRTGG